jgi:hypothetical protein
MCWPSPVRFALPDLPHQRSRKGPPWVPVTAQFPPLFSAFPDWHWEIRNLVVDGDYIVGHFENGRTPLQASGAGFWLCRS